MSIFIYIPELRDYEVMGRGCLLVCRSCGPRVLHYAGPIRTYTCPQCVAQERLVEQAGGMIEP